MKLDPRPLYNRAIEALNEFIEQGQYKPGDRLPAEGDLAKQLGISRPTLREALGNLETGGVIVRRHGVGTFVAAPARGHLQSGLEQLESLRSLAARTGVNEERADWIVDMVVATGEMAGVLDLEPGAALVRVQMTAKEEGYLFAYLDSYIPAHFVDGDDLSGYEEGSLLDYLIERDELKISYTHTDLHAVAVDRELADRLGVLEGKPLLHLAETYYSETGQPIALTLNYFVTGLLNFHIVRRVVRRS
ncbi:MAG: GntR family transcriptional regulator [Ardenticatenaceae bacterium]|nr:GntR family transcriptional regulator [Ardenticatenaceae bacterium]